MAAGRERQLRFYFYHCCPSEFLLPFSLYLLLCSNEQRAGQLFYYYFIGVVVDQLAHGQRAGVAEMPVCLALLSGVARHASARRFKVFAFTRPQSCQQIDECYYCYIFGILYIYSVRLATNTQHLCPSQKTKSKKKRKAMRKNYIPLMRSNGLAINSVSAGKLYNYTSSIY